MVESELQSEKPLQKQARENSNPVECWLQLANLSTSITNKFREPPLSPSLADAMRASVPSVDALMVSQARDLLEAALGSKPTLKDCVEEVFDAFVKSFPVGVEDLENSNRDAEFEINEVCTKRDQALLDGSIRAGALHVDKAVALPVGKSFIFAADDIPAKTELYFLVCGLREMLGRIVEFPKGPRRLRSPSPFLLDSIRISESGRIDTSPATPWRHFVLALHEIEAFRIKRCPICSAFFFAWRKDKHACSDRCLKAWNQRQYRLNRKRYEHNRKWTNSKRRKKQNGKGV